MSVIQNAKSSTIALSINENERFCKLLASIVDVAQCCFDSMVPVQLHTYDLVSHLIVLFDVLARNVRFIAFDLYITCLYLGNHITTTTTI